jgi:EAL domain-containing protein (putative c-di-GMP-specific phosphodiesterase class I)
MTAAVIGAPHAAHHARLTAAQAGHRRRRFLYQFQPKIDLQSGAFGGAAALLRWRHGLFGLQSPNSFVRVAADTGPILNIGARLPSKSRRLPRA